MAIEWKRENKIYICSNQISMKHETCVGVDKFSDDKISKNFWVETKKDHVTENALTVFEGYSMCLLHYI